MSIINWINNHIVTTSLIGIYFFISLITPYWDSQPFSLRVLLHLFSNYDFCDVGMTVICLLLLSGIEASVGKISYCIWLFFILVIIFFFHIFFLRLTVGPTFAIYAPYLAFMSMHKPKYHFLVFNRIRFTDSLFYFIFIIQFTLIHPIDKLIDLGLCICGNIIWKLQVFIFSRRNHHNEGNTQIPLTEDREENHDNPLD